MGSFKMIKNIYIYDRPDFGRQGRPGNPDSEEIPRLGTGMYQRQTVAGGGGQSLFGKYHFLDTLIDFTLDKIN